MMGVGLRRALRSYNESAVFHFFFFSLKSSLFDFLLTFKYIYININITICTLSKLEDVHGKQCRSDGLHKTSLLMKLAYCANSHINGALWRYTDRIRTVPFMQISGLFFLNGSKITKYSLFVRYAKYKYCTHTHTHTHILYTQYITYIIQAYCALRRSILCILYIIIILYLLSLICFFLVRESVTM